MINLRLLHFISLVNCIDTPFIRVDCLFHCVFGNSYLNSFQIFFWYLCDMPKPVSRLVMYIFGNDQLVVVTTFAPLEKIILLKIVLSISQYSRDLQF